MRGWANSIRICDSLCIHQRPLTFIIADGIVTFRRMGKALVPEKKKKGT